MRYWKWGRRRKNCDHSAGSSTFGALRATADKKDPAYNSAQP